MERGQHTHHEQHAVPHAARREREVGAGKIEPKDAHDKPDGDRPQRNGRDLGGRVSRLRFVGDSIAGRLDRANEVGAGGKTLVEVHARVFSCQVDARLRNAGHARKRALDSRCAGGASHAGDVQRDPFHVRFLLHVKLITHRGILGNIMIRRAYYREEGADAILFRQVQHARNGNTPPVVGRAEPRRNRSYP